VFAPVGINALSNSDQNRSALKEVAPDDQLPSWDSGRRVTRWQYIKAKHPAIWGLAVGFTGTLLLGLLTLIAGSVPAWEDNAVAQFLGGMYENLMVLSITVIVICAIYGFMVDAFTLRDGFDQVFLGPVGGLILGWFIAFSAVGSIEDAVITLGPQIEELVLPEPEPAWWEVWK
jgi:hypothetical protein